MRHGFQKIGIRKRAGHRRSILVSLAAGLVKSGRVRTTLTRAKALRPFVEPLMSLARAKTLANRRRLLGVFSEATVVDRLFNVVGPAIANRSGGYTRVLRAGYRLGDAAPVGLVELVDTLPQESASKGAGTKKTPA